ncbi:MAG: YtxH domain-containing protein [Anaerolineaceae bacterium]|nr:YtxH domain-containing protein [Anaerolineaceae bacterium]
MSDHNDFGAFLIGFIVGGLTGAAVSLLFAPQSGEDTRAFIRDKAIELRDKGSEVYEDVRVKAEDTWKETKVKAGEWSQAAKEKTDELITKGEKVLDENREKLAEAIKPKDKAAE